MTWNAETPPDDFRFGVTGWTRIVIKGLLVGTLTFGCLLILLLLRQIERPIHGPARPWTPHITQFVCRNALRLIGIRRSHEGHVMDGHGALVANHVSWLDIFVLNAEARIYFVAKSEVRGWPAIGWLARATGTLFIKRDPVEAKRQVLDIAARLGLGHQLLFFPEGTSTDGRRVLDFRSTLFQPFVASPEEHLSLQPVTLVYHAPDGADPVFYGWWGDMEFGPNLLKILAAPRHGRTEVIFHDPIDIDHAGGRKALAAQSGRVIRAELEKRLARDKRVEGGQRIVG